MLQTISGKRIPPSSPQRNVWRPHWESAGTETVLGARWRKRRRTKKKIRPWLERPATVGRGYYPPGLCRQLIDNEHLQARIGKQRHDVMQSDSSKTLKTGRGSPVLGTSVFQVREMFETARIATRQKHLWSSASRVPQGPCRRNTKEAKNAQGRGLLSSVGPIGSVSSANSCWLS